MNQLISVCISNFVGYVPQDPYQFVNLSFIPRNLSYLPYLEKNLGAENAAESLKYFGMNTAFISTVAQAYNQGMIETVP